MRFLDTLCPPAFLYAVFLAIHLGFDIADFAFVTAGLKVIFGGVGVYLLNLLCQMDLGIISWVIIATPFIVTTLATSVAIGIQLDKKVIQHFI
jgi:hypothetical protein